MIPADSPLAETLRQQLQTDSGRTAAFDTLIADYARYHAVLVVVGGLLLIATAVAAAWCWRRFRRARRSDTASRFERRVYAGFAAFGVLLAMFLALIVAANAGNARNPEPGLAGVVGIVAAPTTPATPTSGSLAELRLAYDQWLTGSDAQLPPVVSRHLADRLAWQRPKAILSCLGLLAAAGLVALTWRTLIRRSRTPEWRRRRTDLAAAGRRRGRGRARSAARADGAGQHPGGHRPHHADDALRLSRSGSGRPVGPSADPWDTRSSVPRFTTSRRRAASVSAAICRAVDPGHDARKAPAMRADIHPTYVETQVTCTCGNTFTTRSTAADGVIHADVCSACHPFYTGKQKILDSGGRVAKFEKRFGKGKPESESPEPQ